MTLTIPSSSTYCCTQPRFSVVEFEPLLDTDEAASLLRIPPKALQKKARNGVIPGRHVGNRWRFLVSDLNDWLWRQEHREYGARILLRRSRGCRLEFSSVRTRPQSLGKPYRAQRR
jgi:excisionase family DNA binding protein